MKPPLEEKNDNNKKIDFTVSNEDINYPSYGVTSDNNANSINFREFFFSTVEKAFTDEYTRCLNYEDTVTVLCDAYILMFREIDKLHWSPSVQWWIRKNRNAAYRDCIRRKSLSNIFENNEGECFPQISEEDIYALWKRIKKIGCVNAFLLMPQPFGSVKLSKTLLNSLRAMSPQKALTIVTAASITVLSVVVIVLFFTQILPLIIDSEDGQFLGEEEIYLDDSFYDRFNITTVDTVIDDSLMTDVMNEAATRAEEKIKEDEERQQAESQVSSKPVSSTTVVINKDYEFFSRDPKDEVKTTTTTTVKFIAQKVEGAGSRNTAANQPQYTGDEWLDKELKNIDALLLDDSMNDSARLGALYEYVCKYGNYGQCDQKLDTYIDRAKYFFKYRRGTSAEYAAAYYALCSAAGYKCKLVEGYFYTQKGEAKTYYEHVWCMITLNGIDYYFDPEADCNFNGSTVRKNFFMVTKDNSRWKLFLATHKWAGE